MVQLIVFVLSKFLLTDVLMIYVNLKKMINNVPLAPRNLYFKFAKDFCSSLGGSILDRIGGTEGGVSGNKISLHQSIFIKGTRSNKELTSSIITLMLRSVTN